MHLSAGEEAGCWANKPGPSCHPEELSLREENELLRGMIYHAHSSQLPPGTVGYQVQLVCDVETQFAQKRTRNSWDNQPGQKAKQTDCQLPRKARWERTEGHQSHVSIRRSEVTQLPVTGAKGTAWMFSATYSRTGSRVSAFEEDGKGFC